jgi:hypothetical protein
MSGAKSPDLDDFLAVENGLPTAATSIVARPLQAADSTMLAKNLSGLRLLELMEARQKRAAALLSSQLQSNTHDAGLWLYSMGMLHGSYQSSNGSGVIQSTEAGNMLRSDVALPLAVVTRIPSAYTATKLQWNVLTLIIGVVAATSIQGAVWAVWKLLRLPTTSIPK